jgi:hypothetical protein
VTTDPTAMKMSAGVVGWGGTRNSEAGKGTGLIRNEQGGDDREQDG